MFRKVRFPWPSYMLVGSKIYYLTGLYGTHRFCDQPDFMEHSIPSEFALIAGDAAPPANSHRTLWNNFSDLVPDFMEQICSTYGF